MMEDILTYMTIDLHVQFYNKVSKSHIVIIVANGLFTWLGTIVTFTYSDILTFASDVRLRVALVRQEMLTRSGAPDFIWLPFGWRIHFAMSLLPPFGI